MRGVMIAAVSLLAACNSVLGVSDVELEMPDASMAQPTPDAPMASCMLETHFASLVATDSNAYGQLGKNNVPLFALGLNSDASNIFDLGLYANAGGHTTFVAGGSYPLNPADAALSTCGICATADVDFDQASNSAAQSYQARGQGDLSITRLDSTGFTGRIRNLVLRHVLYNTDTKATTDAPDGCETAIDDLQFNVTLHPATATAAAPSSLLRRQIGRE